MPSAPTNRVLLVLDLPVSCPRNSRYIVAIKMGRRQGGPSRTGIKGASRTSFRFVAVWFASAALKLVRDVTDEQRGRRPIFIATLRAGASWLFFRVARSTRMTQIWVLYRQSGSDRLEKQPTDLRQYTCYCGDRTLVDGLVLLFPVRVITLGSPFFLSHFE